MSAVLRLPRWLHRHKLVGWLAARLPAFREGILSFNGAGRLVADFRDAAPRQTLFTGQWEPEFFALARRLLDPAGDFLDVGGNFGFVTFGVAAGLAGAPPRRTWVFEANPHLCALLRRSAALHPGRDVRVVHGCVTDTPGVSHLTVDSANWGASHVTTDAVGRPEAPNVVLDTFLEAEGFTRAGLVKMDIEGFEPAALRGLERTLGEGRVDSVLLEANGPALERYGESPAGLLEWLASRGCEAFFCKDTDFAAGVAQPEMELPDADAPPLLLAPARDLPAGHQTDLLILPAAGRLRARVRAA